MKKVLALLMVTALFLSSISLVLAIEVESIVGDVNDDGAINQYDYILVKRHYFGTRTLSIAELERADVNYDGDVNQYDYILLCRHYFGTYTIQQDNGSEDGEDDIPSLKEVPNIVSQGKQYVTTPSADSSYEDTYNSELTDGNYNKGSSYLTTVFSGFSSNFNVVIDLVDDGKELNRFEASVLSTQDAGINLPSQVIVFGSNNNNTWEKIGLLKIPEFKEGAVLIASLELDEAVDYRYIKFSFTRKAAWVFVDELFVYSSIPKYEETLLGKLQDQYVNSHKNDSVYQANLNSVKSEKTYDPDKGMSSISRDCDYEIDTDKYDWRTDENYGYLTDGTSPGSAYERDVWVGIDSDDRFSVTIDLGEVRDNIVGFALHAFNRPNSNIFLPYYVDVLVSVDGEKYVNIGRCYAADTLQENYSYWLNLGVLINARYVKFNVSEVEGSVWFEEIEVYENENTEFVVKSVYGDFNFETTSDSSYWEKGDDYDKTQNLILGKTQEITTDDFVAWSNDPKSNTQENTTLLTDGKTTNSSNCYAAPWVHFVYGGGRTIYYDLGHISSISSFTIRFLDYDEWAIHLPTDIMLALSEDGEHWYSAATVTPEGNGTFFVNTKVTLDKSYRARYAMIYLRFSGHVFLDEITINGTKNIDNASQLNGLTEVEIESGAIIPEGFAAPSDELLGGVKDVCLIYHNYITTNENFFKPYVGYVDENGQIVDTMFDGYLFLPSTGNLPSGGRPWGTNYATDWNYLFNELFKSGVNFDALNRTAETTKAALGLDELKLKVFVTIPHMDDTLYSFGDIDLDGDNDPLTTLEGRVYAAQAYAERVIKKFDSMGYANLELCGFYWFHEEISGGDVQTAKEVNKMFDEIGYQLFWIPYFQANGYARWQEFGFDVCCYQPNYAFSINVEESRIEQAVTSAITYGMCIEMEIDGAALGDERFFNKYMGYLSYGEKLGYMNGAIHMYYQGHDDFGKASRSDDPVIRLIYEYTHDFIKGTINTSPDSRETLQYVGKKNKLLIGTLSSDDDLITTFKASRSPEHGSVTITNDGEFVYYPNAGFTGEDSFTYKVSNRLGWSEECTVTIKVE